MTRLRLLAEPDDIFFLPYQKAWLEDASPLRICEKSRQVGMSYADSYHSVRLAVADGARLDVWVMSRDQIQARQYLRCCKRWARALHHAAQAYEQNVLRRGRDITAQVLRFGTGRRIFCLSSNPDALAGKTGHVKLDEFALHRQQRELYAVAKPVTQWGGTLSLISTHRGAHTVFNEILEGIRHRGNPMGWSLHHVPIQRAVAEGLLERINGVNGRRETPEAWLAHLRSGCLDQESWLQEYCCVPADESAAFLSHELITACEYGPDESWAAAEPLAGGQLFLGVDVGRDHDLTVIWVCERVEDVFFTRAMECLKEEPFEAQEAALYAWLERPGTARCCIDATGIGRQFCERAQQRFGHYVVEAVQFSGRVKEELAYPVRAALEARRVRLPPDPAVRSDLRAIRKEVTAAGNLRFSADCGKDGHADRFWALALALHAGATLQNPGKIYVSQDARSLRAISRRRSREP